MPVEFEWDDAKAASNLAKHRFSFEDAAKVFNDPAPVVLPSIRTADGEDRFKAIGRIADRIFTVVYSERGSATRLISARPANTTEEKAYGHNSPQT